MAERKSINKKTRFEVFKRDKFTCQYCGRMSPDVVLEIDHIKPVAEGGDNSLLNLITSCRDCNRGKGKRRLDDDLELKKQQEEMQILAEKREQLKMLMEWRTELSQLIQEEVNYVYDYIQSVLGMSLNDKGKPFVMSLIKQFGINDVLDGIDISISQYFRGDVDSAAHALKMIGGICYNRRKTREENNGDIQKHTDSLLDGHEDC